MSGTEIAEDFKLQEFYFMFNLHGWVVFWGMNNFIKSMGDQFDHLNLLTSMFDEFIPQRMYTVQNVAWWYPSSRNVLSKFCNSCWCLYIACINAANIFTVWWPNNNKNGKKENGKCIKSSGTFSWYCTRNFFVTVR